MARAPVADANASANVQTLERAEPSLRHACISHAAPRPLCCFTLPRAGGEAGSSRAGLLRQPCRALPSKRLWPAPRIRVLKRFTSCSQLSSATPQSEWGGLVHSVSDLDHEWARAGTSSTFPKLGHITEGLPMWGRARPRAASANVVQLALILAALHLPVSGHAAPPADEQAVVLDGLPQVPRLVSPVTEDPHLPVRRFTDCEPVDV